MFASVSSDKSLRLQDVRQQKPTQIEHTKEEILTCKFNNSGTVLSTSNYNEEVFFYDTKMWRVQSFVSGGQDSLIAFWDVEELLCTGTLSFNDYQVQKLGYNSTGELLSAICYDEILKKF